MRVPPHRARAHRLSAIQCPSACHPPVADGEQHPRGQALRRSGAVRITAAQTRERNAMRGLSISAAWEETREILARDGRLLTTVALALIALPTTVNTLINPGGVNAASTPLWMDCVALVAYLIALAGQLALIRLALGPSITVGGAFVFSDPGTT